MGKQVALDRPRTLPHPRLYWLNAAGMAVLVGTLLTGSVLNAQSAQSCAQAVLDSFGSGTTSRWATYNDSASTITVAIEPDGRVSGPSMRVDYRIASGGFAGVYQGYPTGQNWSCYRGLSFWFIG